MITNKDQPRQNENISVVSILRKNNSTLPILGTATMKNRIFPNTGHIADRRRKPSDFQADKKQGGRSALFRAKYALKKSSKYRARNAF